MSMKSWNSAILRLPLLDDRFQGGELVGPEFVKVGAHCSKSIGVDRIQMTRTVCGESRQTRLVKGA